MVFVSKGMRRGVVPRCDYLNQRQQSVLVGTLLGDAYLSGMRKPHHLVSLKFQHGIKQRDYLKWKMLELQPLFLDQKSKEDSYFHPKQNKTYPYVWTLSYGHPVLVRFKRLFYSRSDEECVPPIHKKMITPEILEMVDDLALAVWYLDDGSYRCRKRGGGRVRLYVGAVSELEYKLVFDWLISLGLHPHVGVYRNNSREFSLSIDESEVFLSRIRSHVPECMNYKLGIVA